MTASLFSPAANQGPMRELRRALDDLEDLKALRAHTVTAATKALATDDIHKEILQRAERSMKESGGMEKLKMEVFEEVFEVGLKKFGKFKIALDENDSRQEDLLSKIKVSISHIFPFIFLAKAKLCLAWGDILDNKRRLIKSRLEDPRLKSRETALQQLDLAFNKYQEITINLQEGLKFYSQLSLILSDLREACKQWAYSRTVEARDQINSLTALAFEGVSISVKNPGMFNPLTDGGFRFG